MGSREPILLFSNISTLSWICGLSLQFYIWHDWLLFSNAVYVIMLQPATLLKLTLLHEHFSCFLNYKNATKLRNVSHISTSGKNKLTKYLFLLLTDFMSRLIIVTFKRQTLNLYKRRLSSYQRKIKSLTK